MKSFLTIAILLGAISASAEIVKMPCQPSDYASISNALKTWKIQNGKNLKVQVQSMLTQEMGPRCDLVYDTSRVITIPGRKSSSYELSSGGTSFSIVLVIDKESRSKFVSIYKTK